MGRRMKLYYDDALQAAWMTREFNVKITAPVATGSGGLEQSKQRIPAWVWGRYIENQARSRNGFKYYIHPDNSYDIFKPQVGDLIKGCDSKNYILRHMFYTIYSLNGIYEDENNQETKLDGNIKEIIQRNGKPFFNPKVQNEQL